MFIYIFLRCFISIVEQIDSTIAVKTKNGEVQRCRVILTNNKDWKVQVTIWGDNIDRVIHNFKTSFVSFYHKIKIILLQIFTT